MMVKKSTNYKKTEEGISKGGLPVRCIQTDTSKQFAYLPKLAVYLNSSDMKEISEITRQLRRNKI